MTLLATMTVASCAPRETQALRFSTWGSLDEIETLKPLLAEFERQNPDVPVELIHIPDAYPHKVRLMAASGKMPDVLFMESQILPGFANRDVLRDLGPFIEADAELKRDDFYRPVMDAMSWKGTLYGIPRDLSNLVMFYNQRLFDEAGVPYPKPDWTYEDMVAKAKRLTHGDQFGVGFAPYPLYWLPYLWSDGGDLFDPARTRSILLESKSLAALKRYRDLRFTHGVAPTEAQVGNARMSQLFAQGKLAMMVGGRWVVPGFRKKLDFPWDVAPFPRGKAGSVVDADASGWCISASSKQPEKAWRLIRFLASKPAISAFTESGLIVPSRPDVARSPAFQSGAPASSQVFLDVIASARPTPTTPSYDEIQYELIDSLGPAWNGEVELEEALKPIVKRIDALLQEEAH
ncbi:Cyclodextrin-binding protein precursor [compost metagenome]